MTHSCSRNLDASWPTRFPRCPEGTEANSPRFQPGGWDTKITVKSRRDDGWRRNCLRPFGTRNIRAVSNPQVETWGYLPWSLRDHDRMKSASAEQNWDNHELRTTRELRSPGPPYGVGEEPAPPFFRRLIQSRANTAAIASRATTTTITTPWSSACGHVFTNALYFNSCTCGVLSS